jgi:hypothetical protein
MPKWNGSWSSGKHGCRSQDPRLAIVEGHRKSPQLIDLRIFSWLEAQAWEGLGWHPLCPSTGLTRPEP